MIERYKNISIIYGGRGKKYADDLNRVINEYEKLHRYPLSSRIVMESILTGDVLDAVTALFDETEICIAILTLEDCSRRDDGEAWRLRQNVVFELGMALYKLGREKCILLGDFENTPGIIELPSDMDTLNIRFFNEETQKEVFDDVLRKILQLSQRDKDCGPPQYDNLLRRDTYFVDYRELFNVYDNRDGINNRDYLQDLLREWLDECRSLRYFDERLIHTAERIAFMPVFGKQDAVSNWYTEIEKVLGDYSSSDIEYYGSPKLLKFGKNTLSVVISYSKHKMVKNLTLEESDYEDMLSDLELNKPPEGERINPLLEVLYYDYMGLMRMHLYSFSSSFDDLLTARMCYEKIIDEYLDKVDLGLSVWGGFLYYNLARLLGRIREISPDTVSPDEITDAYRRATNIRKKWLSRSGFNSMIHNALSYEYFISKLDYIHQMKVMNLKAPEDIQKEYCKVEGEIESYCNDEKLERLLFVQEKLNTLRSEV